MIRYDVILYVIIWCDIINRRWYVMRRDEKKKNEEKTFFFLNRKKWCTVWKTTNFNELFSIRKESWQAFFFKILFCWKHLIGKENRPSKLLVLSVKLYITDFHIWSSHCKEFFFILHFAHFFILILLCFWWLIERRDVSSYKKIRKIILLLYLYFYYLHVNYN